MVKSVGKYRPAKNESAQDAHEAIRVTDPTTLCHFN